MEMILDKDIYYKTLMGELGCNVRIIKDDDDFYRVYFGNPNSFNIVQGFSERHIVGYANYIKTNYLKLIPCRRIQWIDKIDRGYHLIAINTDGHINFKVRSGHFTECFWGREFVKKTFHEYYLFEFKLKYFEIKSELRDILKKYLSQINFFLRRTCK